MSNKASILVADDEESLRLVLQTALKKVGYTVDTTDNGRDAIRLARENYYDVVILDIRMPELDGLQAFYEIHDIKPDLPVILMTAFGSSEIAVEAMKRGAFDYIPKPFILDEVKIIVTRAIHMRKLTQEVQFLTQEVKVLSQEPPGQCKLIGESPRMQDVYKSIGRVANSKATVLLTGESGTGKGMVAKTIHYTSERHQKPFVQVNCGAIPEGLLESELFGHEKGAFTGALNQRPGKFELAEGGTIFLDEIAEMSPNLQVKLLRVLQDKEYERVGGSTTFKANVRVIAATNRDLTKEIAEKRFRADLYYRLNIVSITQPSLCARGDDMLLLADYFLKRFTAETGRLGMFFSPEVLDVFKRYPWPGNVRELENAVEHAVIMSSTRVIIPEHLPLNIIHDESEDPIQNVDQALLSLREVLFETEKRHIAEALERTEGNHTHAAKLLQISRRALLYKIQEHRLG